MKKLLTDSLNNVVFIEASIVVIYDKYQVSKRLQALSSFFFLSPFLLLSPL